MTTLEILGTALIPISIILLIILICICCSDEKGIVMTEKELKKCVSNIVLKTLKYIDTIEEKTKKEINYGELIDYIEFKTHIEYSNLINNEED